jgi:hypothetical protein
MKCILVVTRIYTAWWPARLYYLVASTFILPGGQHIYTAWWPAHLYCLVVSTFILPGGQHIYTAWWPAHLYRLVASTFKQSNELNFERVHPVVFY